MFIPRFRSPKGFTLIELLVVIAIIGILASIVLVSLTSARAKGRDARRVSELKEISKLIALNADPAVNIGYSGIQSLTPGFVRLSLLTAPVSFAAFKDISGITTACTPTFTTNCDYAMATAGVLGSTGNVTTQRYMVCARLETNYGPLSGTAGGGLVSVSDKTGGGVVAGCAY